MCVCVCVLFKVMYKDFHWLTDNEFRIIKMPDFSECFDLSFLVNTNFFDSWVPQATAI